MRRRSYLLADSVIEATGPEMTLSHHRTHPEIGSQLHRRLVARERRLGDERHRAVIQISQEQERSRFVSSFPVMARERQGLDDHLTGNVGLTTKQVRFDACAEASGSAVWK